MPDSLSRSWSTPTGGLVRPPLTRQNALISLTNLPRRQAPSLTALDKT